MFETSSEEIKKIIDEIHRLIELFQLNRQSTDVLLQKLNERLIAVEKEIKELKEQKQQVAS